MLLIALCIAGFWWGLHYIDSQISTAIAQNIKTLLTNYPNYEQGSLPETINAIRSRGVSLVFGGIVLLAVVFGVLLSRVTLRPARRTLHYQKIFISNVAHELRTPLSTIKTSTEVALLDKETTPQLRKVLLEIVAELDRVSEIINNLLSLNTFTRPERMQFQNTDLGPLVDVVVARHQALARERGIELVVKMDSYRTVWGNASALEQVVTNLLRNAIHYTPKGSGGTVSLAVRPDYRGAVELSVSDTGIGISQEDLFHIFEPFYRADTSRMRNIKAGGSGLGLTIVNEIVRMHHGRINVQSAKRNGTTVSVFLPAGVQSGGERSNTQGKHGGNRSEISLDFSKGYRPQ